MTFFHNVVLFEYLSFFRSICFLICSSMLSLSSFITFFPYKKLNEFITYIFVQYLQMLGLFWWGKRSYKLLSRETFVFSYFFHICKSVRNRGKWAVVGCFILICALCFTLISKPFSFVVESSIVRHFQHLSFTDWTKNVGVEDS